MAAGEAACVSVHGANRLGANSMLDIIVFGRAAANKISEISRPGDPLPPLPVNAGEEAVAEYFRLLNGKGSVRVAELREEMQHVMQNNASVYRTKELLEQGNRMLFIKS